MNLPRKYRVLAVVLSFLFALSTIGVPIVVVTCPMMLHSSKPCCASNNSSAHVRIGSTVNTSCCRTIIAGERNTTEFIRVQHQIASPNPATLLAVVSMSAAIASESHGALVLYSESLPPPRDVPALTSSLLI